MDPSARRGARCAKCAAPRVLTNGKLVCPRPACPGHQDEVADSEFTAGRELGGAARGAMPTGVRRPRRERRSRRSSPATTRS
jgi:hypothetical protein